MASSTIAAVSTASDSQSSWPMTVRYGLLIIGIAPVAAQIIGSTFNIWYNQTHIRPLLSPGQFERFMHTVQIYNACVYPAAVAIWIGLLLSLRKTYRDTLQGITVEPSKLQRCRRRTINLPWGFSCLAGTAWLLCIPIFLLALKSSSTPLDPRVIRHLPVSFIIGGVIGVTHGFFAVELLTQRLMFPVLFQNARPSHTPGAFPLSLSGRGIMWAISASVCPIASLLLLSISDSSETQHPWFAVFVGIVGILFGLTTAWMLGQIVTRPVHALRLASQAIASGDLEVYVNHPRADEFGPLIDEFNHMVAGMREKQHLQETFGCHVGREASKQILHNRLGVGGEEEEITVMFADLRNFTALCSDISAQEVVKFLNLFLTEMVEIVEQHGGMVNKFLGDGFMAIFGAGNDRPDHASKAVSAAKAMLNRMYSINKQLGDAGKVPLSVGVGLHTGIAVVGSIGSSRRLEYTAIGDTVNVASRVESLTKKVGSPILMTTSTRDALDGQFSLESHPPQRVKGKSKPIEVFSLRL